MEKSNLREQIEEIIQVVYRNGVIDGKQGTQMLTQDIVISETVRDLLALISARDDRLVERIELRRKSIQVLIDRFDLDIDKGIMMGLDKAIQLIREGDL